MGNGRFNRTTDSELKIMASAALTPGGAGATANSTGVAITSVGSGDDKIDLIFNVSAAAGTIDATNYITLNIQASDDNSTYYTVPTAELKVVETGVTVLGLNTREIEKAVGTSNAGYYRVIATQTGTTATAVTCEAYFSYSE